MDIAARENPRFDHLMHWVPDVPKAADAFTAAGLPAHVNEPTDGFQNGAWRVDERYVEILAICDEERLQHSPHRRGVDLLRPAMEGIAGDRGALTFAVDVADARETADRLQEQGFEIAEFEMNLEKHGVSFVEIFLVNAPVWTPFFVTYNPPRDELLAGIDRSAINRGTYDLSGVVVETAHPATAASQMSTILGLPTDGTQIALPGGKITFEHGDREMVTSITASGAPAPDTEIDGLTVRFGQ